MEQTLVIRRTGEMNREEIRCVQEAANRKALLVRRGRTAVLIGLNILVSLFVLLPLLYAVSVAFMPSSELFTTHMNLLPSSPTLENFRQALIKVPLARFVANSFMVAGLITLGQIISCSLAAFSFSFLDFKGKEALFMLVMATMMIPGESIVLSNYLTMGELGLLDTYVAMILPSLASATTIFFMRQAFLQTPRELYEVATMEGCSSLRFLLAIQIPLSKGAMGAVGIYTFINAWNAYMWPLLVTNTDKMRTVQIGIGMLLDAESADYNVMMAGVIIVMLPTLLLFTFGQKYILSGALSGAMKG